MFSLLKNRLLSLVCLGLLLLPGLAEADAVQQLEKLLKSTNSATAEFSQEVRDGKGALLEKNSGTLWLARPGRFRWQYAGKDGQLIVADGSRLWVYDPSLEQVTVRPLKEALGTPAAILVGENDLKKDFIWKDLGEDHGLARLQATPKNTDAGFKDLTVTLDGEGGLRGMVLHDAFGNTTTLRFSGYQRNAAVADNLFRFTPPKGSDVIGADVLGQ